MSMASFIAYTGSDLSTLRANICTSYITSTARERPGVNEDVIRELVLKDILSSFRSPTDQARDASTSIIIPEPHTGNMETWTGLFSENDIMRFGLRSRSQIDPSFQTKFQEELDALMLSISCFLYANSDLDHVSDAERLERAWSLPEQILFRQKEIVSNLAALDAAYHRIENMIEKTTQEHLHLRENLLEMISKYPAAIKDKRVSTNDLISATIEISLIKLSLVRARAHQALYHYRSTGRPQANMTDALSAAYTKLTMDEQKMEEEEASLDCQLKEYETMLLIIDGRGGGFAQVVEDWTRLQKEKEECRRDLRRLGWTGD